MRLKTVVSAVAVVIGLSVFAEEITISDGGTASIDLQSGDNAAGNRIVFAGSGTLTLTNPGSGEVAFLPQIIAAEEGAEIVVDASSCAGHELRLKNHVSAKGSLAVTGPTVVKFGDTAVTPATLDAATAVVEAFPMLDVAALAPGMSITVDGAAQITKAQTGFTYGDNAFVALSGEKVFGEEDEVALGFNAVLVATNAFASGATVKVAAGKTFGYYPATVNDDFTWTELSGSVTVDLSVALGGDSKDESAEYHLWATAATTSHTFNGAITGYGNVNVRPMRSNSPTITYYFCGRNTCVGTFTSTKVTNMSFQMGVPEDGKLGFKFNLTNINSIYFYSGNEYGAATVTVPWMKAGYFNTTLGVKGGQTVVLKEIASGTGGLQVTGDNGKGSKFVLEKNNATSNILRMQYVDYTLDDATWAANPYVVYDQNYSRVHFGGYANKATPTTATKNNLLYGTAGDPPFDVDVLTEGSFQNAEDKFRFHVFENARFSLNNAGADLIVDVANGAMATITGAIGANAKITAKAGSTVKIDATFAGEPTISAEQGAKVVLTEKTKDLAVVSSGATVNYTGTEGWQDMVALWVDASKPETLKPLTNATGEVVYQERGTKNCGEATNCVARAWWYDWREEQTTYYLYNNRSYNGTGGAYSGVNYVNPWWQPTGGPTNGPCVHFGPVSGNASSAGTPARLEVHKFGEAQDKTATIATKYVLMVYGASSHQAMRGGSALYYNGSENIQRSVDSQSGTLEDPVLNAKGTTDYDVRMDGADATKGSVTCFKAGGGWQIIGIDVPDNTGNFSGLGRRYSMVGGGQMYAEVLVFSERPTDGQIAAAERYLAKKWGLTLQKESADVDVTANVTGTGTIHAGESVNLTLVAGFRGTVETSGGTLTLPSGRLVPDERVVPSDGQLAWFDPSVTETLKLAEISDDWIAEHPGMEQTNEFVWVYDRVPARRGRKNVSLASTTEHGAILKGNADRRMFLLRTAFGGGEVMNWLDGNNHYQEYAGGTGAPTPYQWGNSMRFWTNDRLEDDQGATDQAISFKTAFIVQESSRGGGTPVASSYTLSDGYARSADPKAALWNKGVDASLTGGTVWVNSNQVADPMKSAEFTGGPEVLTIQTASDTTFPVKAIGNYADSQNKGSAKEVAACYGEILFYDRELAAETRQDIEAYLAWKWFGGVTTGYVMPKAFEISGEAAVSAETQDGLPAFADGFTGSVAITATGLAFELDSAVSTETASRGFFDVKGGTLSVGEGACTVTVTEPSRAAKGTYKLIGWTTVPEVTFTLASDTVNGKPAALKVEDDGLYVELQAKGLTLLIK